MRVPPLFIDKFRSDTTVPNTKCRIHLIKSYANYNRKKII